MGYKGSKHSNMHLERVLCLVFAFQDFTVQINALQEILVVGISAVGTSAPSSRWQGLFLSTKGRRIASRASRPFNLKKRMEMGVLVPCIYNHITQKNSNSMNISAANEQTQGKSILGDSIQLTLTLQDSLDIISSYLSPEALYNHTKDSTLPADPFLLQEPSYHEDLTLTNSNQDSPLPHRRKSVFHNFQKHLICLLRKHFDMTDLATQNPLAHKLWSAFTASKCSNKKILNLVFGISSPRSREELQCLAMAQPGFKRVLDKAPIERLEEAQSLLRERVVMEAGRLDRGLIQETSNIGKFKEFYIYFQEFVVELGEGPLLKRVSKKRREEAIELINNLE